MDDLGWLIENLLYRKELWEGYCRHWVMVNWGLLVGEKIAQVSEVREASGDLFRVTVRDATWAYHLCLLKPGIIRKIKARFPGLTIRDIYFQVGDLARKEKTTGNREYKNAAPDARAQLEGEKFRQNIRFLREQCIVFQGKE